MLWWASSSFISIAGWKEYLFSKVPGGDKKKRPHILQRGKCKWPWLFESHLTRERKLICFDRIGRRIGGPVVWTPKWKQQVWWCPLSKSILWCCPSPEKNWIKGFYSSEWRVLRIKIAGHNPSWCMLILMVVIISFWNHLECAKFSFSYASGETENRLGY